MKAKRIKLMKKLQEEHKHSVKSFWGKMQQKMNDDEKNKVIKNGDKSIFVFECSKCKIGFASEELRNEHEGYCNE